MPLYSPHLADKGAKITRKERHKTQGMPYRLFIIKTSDRSDQKKLDKLRRIRVSMYPGEPLLTESKRASVLKYEYADTM
jgi:hypothetical protein